MTRHASQEDVYNLLREEILTLKVKPGTMLSENSIAARFGLSRTPVRSIVSKLSQEGLVVMQGRKGNYVSLINLDYAEQIIFLRIQLEAAAMHYVIHHPDALLFKQMEQNLAQQDRVRTGSLSPDDFYKIDSDFHALYIHSAKRFPLWQIIRSMDVHYSRYRHLDYSLYKSTDVFSSLYDDHIELLKILRERRIEKVRRMISEHLYSGMVRIGNHLYDQYTDYFEPGSRTLDEILRDVRLYLDELPD